MGLISKIIKKVEEKTGINLPGGYTGEEIQGQYQTIETQAKTGITWTDSSTGQVVKQIPPLPTVEELRNQNISMAADTSQTSQTNKQDTQQSTQQVKQQETKLIQEQVKSMNIIDQTRKNFENIVGPVQPIPPSKESLYRESQIEQNLQRLQQERNKLIQETYKPDMKYIIPEKGKEQYYKDEYNKQLNIQKLIDKEELDNIIMGIKDNLEYTYKDEQGRDIIISGATYKKMIYNDPYFNQAESKVLLKGYSPEGKVITGSEYRKQIEQDPYYSKQTAEYLAQQPTYIDPKTGAVLKQYEGVKNVGYTGQAKTFLSNIGSRWNKELEPTYKVASVVTGTTIPAFSERFGKVTGFVTEKTVDVATLGLGSKLSSNVGSGVGTWIGSTTKTALTEIKERPGTTLATYGVWMAAAPVLGAVGKVGSIAGKGLGLSKSTIKGIGLTTGVALGGTYATSIGARVIAAPVGERAKELGIITGKEILPMAVGGFIGARSMQTITKKLPYEISTPRGIEPQFKRVNPMTGKIELVGKYKYTTEIPAQKVLVQKRYESWLGKKPKLIELTKEKVRLTYTPDIVTVGKPGIAFETRAVSPKTLNKFITGETSLVVKPRIIGGESYATELGTLKGLPKYEQRMWMNAGAEAQGGTISSLKRTPQVLKEFGKSSSDIITYSPLESLGKKITRTRAITISKPVTSITKDIGGFKITKKISEENPFEFYKTRTYTKDLTKATGGSPRATGKIPELDITVMRLKKVIGEELPSKSWGITPANIKKTPMSKTFELKNINKSLTNKMEPLKQISKSSQQLKTEPLTMLPKPQISKLSFKGKTIITKPSIVYKIAPSVWAGTGMYEKTTSGGLNVAPLKHTNNLLGLQVIPNKRNELLDITIKKQNELFDTTINKQNELIVSPITKPITKPINIQLPIIKQLPATKQIFSPITKQLPVTKQITKLELINKPISRTDFTKINRPTPGKPLRIIPVLDDWKKRKNKIKTRVKPQINNGAYGVYAKEQKSQKWKSLSSVPLTRSRALDYGSYLSDRTLSAQYKIKNIKGKPQVGKLNIPSGYYNRTKGKFRDYKIVKGKKISTPNTFIEHRNKRLDTKDEVKKITLYKKLQELKTKTKKRRLF